MVIVAQNLLNIFKFLNCVPHAKHQVVSEWVQARGCRLGHGLAGASESGLPVLRGIIDIRTPHMGEEVAEVV